MIEFLKMKETDIKDVQNFLTENKIYESGIEKYYPFMFIIKQEEKIFGLGVLDFIKGIININNIYVEPNNRKKGLGEGLLRTMLNFVYINGNKFAYYLGDNEAIYSFFNKIGFKKYKENKLYIDIEEFFCQPCQGTKL
jgi:N-acetylglutamate synthase-like GNAT family acetyltransferase